MNVTCGWCGFSTDDIEQAASHVIDCKNNPTATSDIPIGYAETMDCLNKPQSWDVPGMIADMAEHLRVGNEVPAGQLLAALDWMTFRLQEASSALLDANVTDDTRAILKKIRGFSYTASAVPTTASEE